ncbi:hypothetical protein [Shinella sp.]|uniref:hypothetical protein n=1 Tax=Shinella sp. TaxID=1870904 RepID=UPI00258D09EE|nr:hypothetical protein [Shinella sp.]MCO5136268.1 hypothetical protein [Shinella sp.]
MRHLKAVRLADQLDRVVTRFAGLPVLDARAPGLFSVPVKAACRDDRCWTRLRPDRHFDRRAGQRAFNEAIERARVMSAAT